MASTTVTNMLDVIGVVDEWQRRAEVYILCDPLRQNSRTSSEACLQKVLYIVTGRTMPMLAGCHSDLAYT